MPSYYEVLTAAVADLVENGYDSAERVAYWTRAMRETAEASLRSESELTEALRSALTNVYGRLVEKGGLFKYHVGIERVTIERIRPYLRAELDRRIRASAELIRLNRQEAIQRTLRRFSGWATSVPPGGARELDRRKLKIDVRKPLTSLPFEERRVLIDQGHKLTSSINDIVAKQGAALAGIWHSHWRQADYNYRVDHKERDLLVYSVRGNWALKDGLMVVGPNGYTDKITAPGEEPFCRCFYQYLYTLRKLPTFMLTKRGQFELERARSLVAAM